MAWERMKSADSAYWGLGWAVLIRRYCWNLDIIDDADDDDDGSDSAVAVDDDNERNNNSVEMKYSIVLQLSSIVSFALF